MTNEDAFNAMLRVLETLDNVAPEADHLEVLQLVWVARADHARRRALGIPGGFPEERARQLDQLEKVAALVRSAEPDLEHERLHQEGDLEKLLEHVNQKLAPLAGPTPDNSNHGGEGPTLVAGRDLRQLVAAHQDVTARGEEVTAAFADVLRQLALKAPIEQIDVPHHEGAVREVRRQLELHRTLNAGFRQRYGVDDHGAQGSEGR